MRRILFAFLLAASLMAPACASKVPQIEVPLPSYWPTQGWQTSTPEAQGFDSAKLAEGLQAMRDQGINIHSLTIIRNDKMILDAYFYPYDGSTYHEIASVTKSVLTTLIGIAADQGKLSLDDRLVSFFPDRTIANRGFWKNRITVGELASMTSGLDCISANDEQTLREMGGTPDWVQFTLDLKVTHIPGSHFEYCSPGMHVLSAILQQATGMTAAEFARVNLFEPLGITDFLWEADPQGYSDGWAGLYLHPRDLAKIGFLMLHQGQWEETQIVSPGWVTDATRMQKKTGMGDNYGYGWWVPVPTQFVEFAASGRGGQYIRVFPQLNTVVVTTGGGFEWNDITPMLVAAMADVSKPVPEDPTGAEKLETAMTAIQQPPSARTPAPLPQTAYNISGKTYAFEFSPLDIKTVRWQFDDPVDAKLFVTFYNQPDRELLIGMDGVYRMYPIGEHDLLMGMRGSWIDAQTFVLEYDTIANHDAYTLALHFDGDGVTINAKERTFQSVMTLEGKAQDPQ
jgi:CubicO group peptidase (beta-lactamase class C family)